MGLAAAQLPPGPAALYAAVAIRQLALLVWREGCKRLVGAADEVDVVFDHCVASVRHGQRLAILGLWIRLDLLQ